MGAVVRSLRNQATVSDLKATKSSNHSILTGVVPSWPYQERQARQCWFPSGLRCSYRPPTRRRVLMGISAAKCASIAALAIMAGSAPQTASAINRSKPLVTHAGALMFMDAAAANIQIRRLTQIT